MGRAARDGEAAGGQARSTGGRYAGPLGDLRYNWGAAYEFGTRALARGVQFTAVRRDGRGGVLADPLTEGLRLRVIADYSARPVARNAR